MKSTELCIIFGTLALIGVGIFATSRNHNSDYLSGIEYPRDVDQKSIPPLKHAVTFDEKLDMQSTENAELYDEFLQVGKTQSCDLAIGMTRKNNFRQYSLGKYDFLLRLGLETARRYSNKQIVDGFDGGYEPTIIRAFDTIKTEECAPRLNRTFLENYHPIPYRYGQTRALTEAIAVRRQVQVDGYSF